ncbi:MAG TPA: DinB family protein [Vicinamibacterales bacterium]|nr:DinB family protein [Vicinamibacterales bacterium]
MSISGAHALFYTSEPEALRAMLRDVFGFEHVDAGGGWLIFRLPPAELGVHPAEGPTFDTGMRHQLTFMCDDIHATVRDLRAKGVNVQGEPEEESFGLTVMLILPGGVDAMLYEPRHATAIEKQPASSWQALVTLLSEVVYGPAPDAAYLLNPGDRGLLASLDTLTAEMASARPGGRSSVAAHADHLRYGLELLNRSARGEDPWPDADYSTSWSRQEVTDDQWRALRGALASEAHAWLEATKQPRTWDEPKATGALSSVAHLAYHLGAIRQLAAAAVGPREEG